MLITLVLVVGVIFLFLHNGSATLIPALALPFSILGTFAVMQLLDFSLDNLSMMALILSIGFVVDDAIVMLENIVRHMEHGEARARGGAQGIEGDRLHDPHDDDVARGGVHPDAVHGRHPRPAVPRVRGHDHGGDSHLRRRVGHADADAVQPVPARRRHAKTGLRRRCSTAAFDALQRGYERSLGLVLRHRAGDAGRVRRRARRRRCRCSASSRRASSRIRTTTRSTSTCARRRARRSTTWSRLDAAGRRHRHQEPVRRLVHGERRRRVGEQQPHLRCS